MGIGEPLDKMSTKSLISKTSCDQVSDRDHPLWPIFEHHAGGPMGFIWSSKLANVFRLSGLLVIDSALDDAIKKVCKHHELIASVCELKIDAGGDDQLSSFHSESSQQDFPNKQDFTENIEIYFRDFIKIHHDTKAKMDEFSAESNLQWAFNFVESPFTRKTVVENSGETQEQIKYVDQEDLKELLTNYGDTFTDQDFADFMNEIVGGDFLDFFAEDLIATLMTPWVKPPADEKARESMAARPTKVVFPDGQKPLKQAV